MKKHLLITLILSVAVHFVFFDRPNETVFDEVHFGKFISAYYTGEYYFDIHPPLGKLAIAGFAKLFKFEPEYSFINIGDKFPDQKYLALRFLPALAGTLLPVVIYLLILELGMSKIAALAGALLTIFDNALLAQSRLILLDSFLLLFGSVSLLFYFKYSKNRILNTKYLVPTIIFAGLAISIKWTGLSFIVLPILVETCYKFRDDLRPQNKPGISCILNPTIVVWVTQVLKFVSFFLISLTIYFAFFVLHFTLLTKPGPGDVFMKSGFREKNIARNIWDLNIEMYKSNQRLDATHPYGSQWYTWPFMARPIFYWTKDGARIYFFGNPVVWLASTIAAAIGIKYLVLNIKRRRSDKILAILLGGYVLNLLPFIGIKRVMFLYHYLAALVFAILILVYLLDKTKNAKRNFGILIIASVAAFLFFAPLSYGLPLSNKAYEARIWFANWR